LAVFFLDSSALVKRYLSETGSAWVESLFDVAAGHTIFIAAVTGVEIVAAITRRARGGTIPPPDAASACVQLRADLSVEYQVVELSASVLFRAMDLAEAGGLRGYDAVQLASAVALYAVRSASGLPALTFVSADTELNAAATAEGLLVDDPNAHP
jgi:predicted nucleic acid-binding protein